jgi:hypothetical protein
MPRGHVRTSASPGPRLAAARPAAASRAEAAQATRGPEARDSGFLRQRGMQTASTQAAALHQASGGRLGRTGDVLLQMQRQYGNGYVQQVVSRARETAAHASPASATPASATPDAAPAVQAKLLLGPPRDRYEQAADQVAAAATGHQLSQYRQAAEGSIQSPYGTIDAPVAQALALERGSGQPLPAALRQSMEQSLGADFGGVRVHTGGRSDQLNRSLQAAAFTSGNDIFFRRGAYPPAGSRGRALLAHELTHVVQQRHLRRRVIQRYFAAPADPYLRVAKPANPQGRVPKQPHPSKSRGWAISKNVEVANELLVPQGVRTGHKVKRFTALLTPGHGNLLTGAPTQLGTNPLGWGWIERNEVRTASGKLRYWVRFHLLNANLGGKGNRERHLVPTTKTANAQWDRGIERPMTTALKAVPVYYDVKLTYWTRNDAPMSYVDQVTNTDYRDNITLFPRSIEGNWQRFEQNQWVPQQRLTVTVDQPRGISGDEVDLATQHNLKQTATLFHINEQILTLLQHKWPAGRGTPATYRDVRTALEAWAMRGTTDRQVSDRLQAIYESEGYLRTALTGGQSFRLKINGQHVPDDATPRAKMFGTPGRAAIKSYFYSYEQAEGPVSAGYSKAQEQSGNRFPPYENFLWLMMIDGHLDPDSLPAVQQKWKAFKKANKGVLPPMSGTHLVPDKDEIRAVVERRTKRQVVGEVYQLSAQKIQAVSRRPMPARFAVADELADAVDVNYGQLLQEAFANLTVGHAYNPSKLATALLAVGPVQPLAAELDARVAAERDLTRLGIADTLSANPFVQMLGTSMVPEMHQRVAAGLHQQQLHQQQLHQQQLLRQAAAPPPVPTAASRIPRDRSRSPRPQTGNLPILKVGEKMHPGNKDFLLALPGRVRADHRYARADKEKIAERMKDIKRIWNVRERVGNGASEAEFAKALRFIYRLSAFR